MELFLNLCWLSLLAPAYLLWRQRILSLKVCNRAGSSPVPPLLFLCVLGCTLVLLFPVVSASDDLHAMRAEMEESSPCKRTVCQAGGEEKACVWNSRWQHVCAVVATAAAFRFTGESRREFLTLSLLVPAAPTILPAGRAPPASYLGSFA
jgi:hypothetical protein